MEIFMLRSLTCHFTDEWHVAFIEWFLLPSTECHPKGETRGKDLGDDFPFPWSTGKHMPIRGRIIFAIFSVCL